MGVFIPNAFVNSKNSFSFGTIISTSVKKSKFTFERIGAGFKMVVVLLSLAIFRLLIVVVRLDSNWQMSMLADLISLSIISEEDRFSLAPRSTTI